MTPQEKLKKIKETDIIGLDNLFWQEYRWLIARVEQLEKAIRQIDPSQPTLNKMIKNVLHTGPKPAKD